MDADENRTRNHLEWTTRRRPGYKAVLKRQSFASSGSTHVPLSPEFPGDARRERKSGDIHGARASPLSEPGSKLCAEILSWDIDQAHTVRTNASVRHSYLAGRRRQ